ncbi:MAG: hypothetical protein V3V14_00085 [Saprospiraceae bacterium]
MKNSVLRKCLQCEDPVRGRSDKKFCCDDCRTAYNNTLNRDANNFVTKINRILRGNRRILAAFNPTGKTKIKKEKLLTAGFNFGYHTNIYETKAGRVYMFCYDQGYIKLDDTYYALVFRKEYVE